MKSMRNAHENRVELIFFDQPFEMWKFKCDNPVRRQQTGHPGGEVVEIGHLRQYVIADDEIGHAAFRYETPGETQPEKMTNVEHSCAERLRPR